MAMKKNFLVIILLLLSTCAQESRNMRNLKALLEATNFVPYNIRLIDSLLAEDFNYISDSISQTKEDFLNSYKSFTITDSLWTTQLEKTKESKNAINTQEIRTGYIVTTLGTNPISREREYTFNDKNQIKSIYVLSTNVPETLTKFEKYFDLWANIYYPDLTEVLREKRRNGENYFNELDFLIKKLKIDGVYKLDSARLIYERYLKNKKAKSNLPPVPLIDYYFEKILATMQSIAAQENLELPVMDPLLMKRLLNDAFIKNGYSYSRTINKVAEFGFTIEQIQLVQILLFPISNLESKTEISTVFSGQELYDVNKILKMLENY